MRRWGRYAAVVAALLIGAAMVAGILTTRQSRVVRWSEVLEAVSRQRTVNGEGRVYAPDGTEWAVSVWVQVDEQKTFPASSTLLPVGAALGQQPPEETVGTAPMANYLPLLTRLARNHPSTVGRPSEWEGRPVLAATYAEGYGGLLGSVRRLLGYGGGLRLAARMYINPQSKLVQGMELFEQDRLVLRVAYRYSLPLPKGFKAS